MYRFNQCMNADQSNEQKAELRLIMIQNRLIMIHLLTDMLYLTCNMLANNSERNK